MKKLIFILVFLIVLLTACQPAIDPNAKPEIKSIHTINYSYKEGILNRYIDHEYGYICYFMTSYIWCDKLEK